MEGLRRGWTESPERVDREEVLAHVLEGDGHFDEPELSDPAAGLDGEPIPTHSRLAPAQSAFSPYQLPPAPATDPKQSTSSPPSSIPPPQTIPPQPPLLLVPFMNRIGFTQIPLMMVEFFNQRTKVKTGAEAAYRLIMNSTRPISGPPTTPEAVSLFSPDSQRAENDLDFDRLGESYYQSSLSSFHSDIEKARGEYYKALAGRLATARELARGEREPTKEEQNNPPPTEVELRAERMKKEKRWRDNEEGWEIIRPEKDVVWDERFRNALSIFTDPPDEHTDNN